MYTVATNIEGQTRLSQWFEAEGRSSLYFPNNIMSTRVGGCKLTTKTKMETIEKLCRNFAHFTADRTDDELSFIKHKAELYGKKLPMGSSKWGDNYAFVSASPARRPRYLHNQCVPNMLLTAKSNQTSGLRAGLYMCTDGGLTSRGHFRTLEEIKGGAPPSTLEAVVRWCQTTYPDSPLDILVIACTTSGEHQTDGDAWIGNTPFLRPASATQHYAEDVLTKYERRCDVWAEQIMSAEESKNMDEVEAMLNMDDSYNVKKRRKKSPGKGGTRRSWRSKNSTKKRGRNRY